MVCALAAEAKEQEYLGHGRTPQEGQTREEGSGPDEPNARRLRCSMEQQDADILGDHYQGSITYGEAGQYFTPEWVCS
jgi:hypothetical protein